MRVVLFLLQALLFTVFLMWSSNTVVSAFVTTKTTTRRFPAAAAVGVVVQTKNKNTAAAVRASNPLFNTPHMADSSLDVHNLRTLIDNLAPDNFDKSLPLMETLLVNECVGQECEDYLGQLKDKCQEIGKTLPEGFAPTHH